MNHLENESPNDGAASRKRDRIVGALIGGAIGDALGAPVEFMSIEEIRQKFGPSGLINYAPAYGRIGAITDDTQMTLFTAEGLLRAYVRANSRGIGSVSAVVCHAYLRWLLTQGLRPADTELKVDTNGWLWGEQALHSPRAPGRTCVSALIAIDHFTNQRANNDSKGAGGIMRIAPVAAMFAGNSDEARTVFRLAKECAWLTHGHPSGYLSAAAFAVVLHAILCDETLEAGIEKARLLLAQEDGSEEVLARIDEALGLASMSPADPEHVFARLGEGWVGEEALGIALYCALGASDFSKGVCAAVNHSGDSDTTGSLVGQLLGALKGHAAIPPHWTKPLELRDVVIRIANDLCDHDSWALDYEEDSYDSEIERQYPGG